MSDNSLDIYDTDDKQGLQRPHLGVHFKCCSVYTRIYRQPGHEYYVVRCPKCLRSTRVRVGPDGTSQRIFIAD